MSKLASLAAATVTAAALAAPSALAAGSSVGIKLREFKVLPSAASAKAGKVTFSIKNVGTLPHEFVVVKTNLAPSKLPVKNSKAVVKPVGSIKPIGKGKSATLTVTLKAGKYVLLCNIPGHYQAGQFTAFTVK